MNRYDLKCKIAGLNVLINVLNSDCRVIPQSRSYLCDFQGSPQIKIGFDSAFLEDRHREIPSVPLCEHEYIWTGYDFGKKLLLHDGYLLHASAVAYRGRAYLFSAPCGTGKSTHASIWQRVYGDEAVIINDDKPALRLIDGKVYVYGTPWSGKTDKNKNVQVPLGGVCFIERCAENHIETTDIKSAVHLIMSQTLRIPYPKSMEALLEVLDKAIPHIPVFTMGCNMEDSAAICAYEYMSKFI